MSCRCTTCPIHVSTMDVTVGVFVRGSKGRCQSNHPIHKEIQIVKTLQTSKKQIIQEIRCNEREHLAVVLLVPCFLLVVFVRATKCRVMRWTILVAKKEDNMLGDRDGLCRLCHTYQHQGGTTSRHRD